MLVLRNNFRSKNVQENSWILKLDHEPLQLYFLKSLQTEGLYFNQEDKNAPNKRKLLQQHEEIETLQFHTDGIMSYQTVL